MSATFGRVFAWHTIAGEIPEGEFSRVVTVDATNVPERNVVLVDPKGLDELAALEDHSTLHEWQQRFILLLPSEGYLLSGLHCPHVHNLVFAMFPMGAWQELKTVLCNRQLKTDWLEVVLKQVFQDNFTPDQLSLEHYDLSLEQRQHLESCKACHCRLLRATQQVLLNVVEVHMSLPVFTQFDTGFGFGTDGVTGYYGTPDNIGRA